MSHLALLERLYSKTRRPHILAYGAGTDSTAVLVECVRLGVRIDLVLFADTGAELPHTYEYLDVIDAWLAAQGLPKVVRVHDIHKAPNNRSKNNPNKVPRKKGDPARIEEAMWDNLTLPPPAFGKHSCSIRFKIEPCDEYVETWQPAIDAWARGERCVKLIGFEAGEDHRVKRCSPWQETEEYQLVFPLREWGMDREACKLAIHKAGLPQPGKSACFFCPNRKVEEIIEMAKRYPEYAKRALALEAAVQKTGALGTTQGLNRNFSWASVLEKAFAAKAAEEVA